MDVVKYLNQFEKFTENPNLEAMKYLMEKLNNPEKHLKVIHVAGTSGKGSICEMMSGILQNAGYKTGKFISPAILEFNEVISINNVNISNEELEGLINGIDPLIKEYGKVKWFEVITTIALKYFYDKGCDIVVLETGLGGLTDCTNIVPNSISIIGNIGYDHVDILGNTLEKIANQKAGVIKENSETITFYQKGITEIIEKVCKEKNSKLHIINEEYISNYSYNQDYQTFDYMDINNIEINLKGKVQIYNAAICIKCAELLNIKENIIKEGMKNIDHKARFEILSKKPLIIYDGAHNEDKIRNLVNTINDYYPEKKVVYVVSILKTKDDKAIIRELEKTKNAVIFLTNGTKEDKYIPFEYNLEEAIQKAINKYPERLICITGSFYTYPITINFLKTFENLFKMC